MNKVKTETVLKHVIMIFLGFISIAPFALIIMSSLTEESALMMNGYSYLPEKLSLDAYTYIFGGSGLKVLTSYGVSFLVTGLGTLLSVLMTILYAYPLSRKDLPLRNVIAFVLFFTMLFHGGLVPSYIMWTRWFHIKNTIWALIIPNLLMNPFYVIMMRTYITTTIPMELLEAAKIDGAGELKILAVVVAPLSKPMVATIGFMTALGYWNDWTNGLCYVTDENLYSIQSLLNRLMSDLQFLKSSQAAQSGMTDAIMNLPSTGVRMSIAVIGLLPILMVYPFFQKYLVKGIMIGGVKG